MASILSRFAGGETINERANKISEGRRRNELAEIAQPLKIQEAKAQSQDAAIKRGGAAAVSFLSALGDTEGKTPEELNQNWQAAKQTAAQLGHDVERVPDSFSPEWFNAAQGLVEQAGLKGQGLTGKQREFQSFTKAANLSPEELERAARIDLGLDPRASVSAQERIALDEVKAAKVAEQKRREAAATATGKAEGESATAAITAKAKADIASAVEIAKSQASAQGETMTDLKRAQAALPGLRQVTGQLKELASVATSTIGGKLFDSAAKELGFGSTEGANAKAKYIAIVDNQILPLLKQTFGAAFTVQEAQQLRATLGDPESSPTQKQEQLDAFIDAKEREVSTKQIELGQSGATLPASQMSDAELMRALGQ